jgi:protein-L-isoaspartate O-methyltransferase
MILIQNTFQQFIRINQQFLTHNLLEKTNFAAGAGFIKDDRIRQVLLAIDRADFCPEFASAYIDRPQPIGFEATIRCDKPSIREN